ncbi:protein strawberry notch homolog 2-like [Paramormyrops kingsleyae]|uniref:protein strawberry notch homolog 2-like n=1 Tax=Paramormyrops kingsleyae TaxID=1676925 RepID=UPI000CD61BAB|nr:protein strawberry notch homolog 2-like [Paramormyrops kingsleyae]XP_023653714.1 protein strawberry notch homolog 2-like [Paramormyrops kingsleyae]
MPLMAAPPAMDGENHLDQRGPHSDSAAYSVSMQNAMHQANTWKYSQAPLYSAPYPVHSGNQRCPQLPSADSQLDLLPSLLCQNAELPGPSLQRNRDSSQDFQDIDMSWLPSSPDSLSEYVTQDYGLPLLCDVAASGSEEDGRMPLPAGLEDISAILGPGPLAEIKPQPAPEEEEEADEEETLELGHVDTYAEYRPSKSMIGVSHPDIVVETSTLSSVPPPDITYTLFIPERTISAGLLSALQLEAVIYSCQQHEVILQNGQRAGFLIGDGAGVGKGRTLAGIILENFLKGRRKALWFSVSNDLKYDAERDLKDIEAPSIPVYALNKIKYDDTATSEGILFATYSALIGKSKAGSQLRTRLKQILDWCGPSFDGVIVFDECHKAKNATSTKMGKAVLDLQSKLPLARVVYASATGASEPKNMIYMSRLGIWGEGTPFRTFDHFLQAIEKRGVGAMEIVAMDMKVSGMYIARQLSFSGVSFHIEEISLDDDFKLVYNKAAKLWAEALTVFLQAADLLGLVSRKTLWGQFWSAHQRFFKYLCIAAKVRRLVELAETALQQGKCVVIGLQSTGEARTREVLDENDGHLDRFVSAAEGVFRSLVQKHFPSEKQKRDKSVGNKRKRKPKGRPPKYPKHGMELSGVINISDETSTDSDGLDSDSNSSPDSLLDNDDVIFVNHTTCHSVKLEEMKRRLLGRICELGRELPLNTLDELIDRLGGPEKVSEMTGRKGRVVRQANGSVRYESRAEQGLTIDHINIKEKERFMDGEKLVAIISEAASSGISLQADRRIKNQRRRVHLTLELPWSADRAIQQFGRTHRSNQVTAPEYVFLISELAGERRFASIVAKRLESLGALTHGDRRATESRDLSKFNFENKYGTRALDQITKAILGHIKSKVPPPKGYPGGDAMFFSDMKYGLMDVGFFCKESFSNEKDCSITKFLNRILGLEVHKQNSLFQYFSDNFDYLIEMDKKEGKYDMGILDLAPGNDKIYEETQEKFLTPGNPQEGQVILYEVSVDRGLPWEEARSRAQTLRGPDDGFYLSHKMQRNQPCVLLAEQSRGKNLVLYKPNIGRQTQPESLDNLLRKYHKVTPDEAREFWEKQYSVSLTKCSHASRSGRCKQLSQGGKCWMGLRLRRYHMLCGSLLRVWKHVADTVANVTSPGILQIVRLKTKQHSKQVGIRIPENCVPQVRDILLQMEQEVQRQRQERQCRAAEEQALEQQQWHSSFLPSQPPAQSDPVDAILDLTLSSPSPSPDSDADDDRNDSRGLLCPSEPTGGALPYSLQPPRDFQHTSPEDELTAPLNGPCSQLPPPLSLYPSCSSFSPAPSTAPHSTTSSSPSCSFPSGPAVGWYAPSFQSSHCSADALDVRETLDSLFHTSSGRQSVIQYWLPGWDAT